ncbi:MAG: 16S rRNA (guanine(527)-N(7))-methyltransferase RsmG [Erysipelothrix sp.]|nr:16S rRNA (guanine(527)-N(7))-methyltransferase RsmG [Erysipelothrix sp.]
MEAKGLIESLVKHNITLSDKQLEQFKDYRELLQEYNKVMNLTAIIETDEIYIKHFYDSIIPATFIDLAGSLLDVGAGAGFPSIPLKILLPELDVTILEPNNKRVKFLNVLCKKLDINVNIVEERAEDFIKQSNVRYDFVTARAVANLPILLELCVPFAKVNGYFIGLKGSKYEEELKESQNALKELSCLVKEIYTIDLDDALRSIILIEKTKKTKLKYPRNYGQIKKKPL